MWTPAREACIYACLFVSQFWEYCIDDSCMGAVPELLAGLCSTLKAGAAPLGEDWHTQRPHREIP